MVNVAGIAVRKDTAQKTNLDANILVAIRLRMNHLQRPLDNADVETRISLYRPGLHLFDKLSTMFSN